MLESSTNILSNGSKDIICSGTEETLLDSFDRTVSMEKMCAYTQVNIQICAWELFMTVAHYLFSPHVFSHFYKEDILDV